MPKTRGMNSHSIKHNNRGLALQYIMQGQATSRADIAKISGLSRMAVSNIVAELIEDGYLVEKEAYRVDTRGRNPVMLDLSPDAPKIISLYIGRRIVEVVIADLKCNVLYVKNLEVEGETEKTLERKILFLMDNVYKYVNGRILGISVSAVGLVDQKKGEILTPINFFDIKKIDIYGLLSSRYDAQIMVNNDMNNAALLENLFGAGLIYKNFIYLGITTGLGMGMISNGRLYQDSSGFAGEIAHMSIDYNGNPCPCGSRGCLETYVSIPAIYERLRTATGRKKVDTFDFEELAALPEGDAVFSQVVDELTYGLVNIINILNLEAVIIGHEGASIPQQYIQRLEAQINQRIISAGHQHVEVRATSYTDEFSPYRGAASIAEEVFGGRLY